MQTKVQISASEFFRFAVSKSYIIKSYQFVKTFVRVTSCLKSFMEMSLQVLIESFHFCTEVNIIFWKNAYDESYRH